VNGSAGKLLKEPERYKREHDDRQLRQLTEDIMAGKAHRQLAHDQDFPANANIDERTTLASLSERLDTARARPECLFKDPALYNTAIRCWVKRGEIVKSIGKTEEISDVPRKSSDPRNMLFG